MLSGFEPYPRWVPLRCFAWLQRETSRNFFEGNVARVLVHFFFLLPLMFTGLPLVATSISHVVTAAITKFSCRFSNKKVSFVFLSLALDLCRPFYRWASLACRLLSRFLCLSLARLYSRFVGTPINLSLIYFRQYGYRNNFHFSFSSIFTL